MPLSLVSTALALLSITPALAAPTNNLFKRAALPAYALTYAPYTYLQSGEAWFPSDVSTHLKHMSVESNFKNVSTTVSLKTLNTFPSSDYLTSYDNVETNPAWLTSGYGKPNSKGYSAAPATIIAVEKNGFVDVFYFYFYSYNHGSLVLGSRVDNHVGDWEHSMIRFSTAGVPQNVYYSAHSSGTAYTYSAVQKVGVRPVVYSAAGSHANYATAGTQEIYPIIGDIVTDTTDAGTYWDVTQNYRGYYYTNATGVVTNAGGVDVGGIEQASETVDWLYWSGMWGDEQYPTSDSRQNCALGIDDLCHYQSGPTGPLTKNLGRTAVCQKEDGCTVKTSL
ncbi:hypothetical protein M436DRAFT_76766 [Aureobasidium namibiae CBS 147.97]|uniref:Vacuolar protein sorting-associated protein 62 n=1 Tax=Aureobasidium namibiae CBS 147.97 TaxID=1043004 RepID=A0A074WFN6_9PEZI